LLLVIVWLKKFISAFTFWLKFKLYSSSKLLFSFSTAKHSMGNLVSDSCLYMYLWFARWFVFKPKIPIWVNFGVP
jgi:hypothetical protein